ncbi:Gfo/Idh/MocA family protein [Herbaspirillum chlorophenolicum]|uniref:Gfo/Idh/MocA family protein n=1 Tax=Herbaspirillum chlorophenolicum TaxID=211589 RepID=A0ABW8ESC2_9BURK
MAYSVALIGLGGIGMGYDLKLPAQDHVLSHARALALHPDFEIAGAVDPAPELRETFSHAYGAMACASAAELLQHAKVDVCIVASPTTTHLAVIEEILHHATPQLILCEKPLAYGEGEAQRIVDLCRAHGVALFVNYVRRADPGVMEVRERIVRGDIAAPFKAVVWYSKGLLHNGSHFLDLMTFWFGPVAGWSIVAPGERCGEQDAEPDFRLEFSGGSAIFCAAKEENFSHYTVEVVAANGRLRYEQAGTIQWQAAGPHPTLENYRRLEAQGAAIADDMNRYQYRVADQVSRALQGKPHSLCEGAAGAANIRLLHALLNARTNTSHTSHQE